MIFSFSSAPKGTLSSGKFGRPKIIAVNSSSKTLTFSSNSCFFVFKLFICYCFIEHLKGNTLFELCK